MVLRIKSQDLVDPNPVFLGQNPETLPFVKMSEIEFTNHYAFHRPRNPVFR